MSGAAVSIVVPTLGRSPDLGAVAERLREEAAAAGGELLWVGPEGATPAPAAAFERSIAAPADAGFARAANLGIAAGSAPRVALVNDDALVERGWLARLAAALDAAPRAAAAQGVQLVAAEPERCDGAGLEWSRGWRAIQIAHGDSPPVEERGPFEVFGVSATAALFERRALEAVALAPGVYFDPRLVSWYEDVELAARLRAGGFSALAVPAARALHRGSATGASMALRRARLLTRNRWLVAARLLGRRLPLVAPRLLAGDAAEAARAVGRGDGRTLLGLLAGLAAVPFALPAFARAGAPLVAGAELARLRVGSRP